MKRFLCLAFAIMLCMTATAFATSTTITEVPTPNNGSNFFPPSVDFPLNIDMTGVIPHEFSYTVTIDFTDAAFEYSYSGEYKVNPNTGVADYSGIKGEWTDSEAKVVITCGSESDLVKVWVRESNPSLDADVEITSNNSTSKANPKVLNAGDALEINYTVTGEIPFNDYSYAPNGMEIYPLGKFNKDEKAMKVDFQSISICITDEFDSGKDLWDR